MKYIILPIFLFIEISLSFGQALAKRPPKTEYRQSNSGTGVSPNRVANTKANGSNTLGQYTKEDFKLSAQQRTSRSVELPRGTVQVAIRVTLLGKNQELLNSLGDLVQAIPVPGIAAASGGLKLTSMVMGEDRCNYNIFNLEEDADNYSQTGEINNACYSFSDVHEDARFLNNSACFNGLRTQIWVGFYNPNQLFSERIVLEIVPVVDAQAETGWTSEVKKILIKSFMDKLPDIENKEVMCGCVIEQLSLKYTLYEVQQMSEFTSNQALKESALKCENLTKDPQAEATELRRSLYDSTSDSDRIKAYLAILDKGYMKEHEYKNLGLLYIKNKQYIKAVKLMQKAEKEFDESLQIKITLAHSYLLNEDIELAKSIYKKYKNQQVENSLSKHPKRQKKSAYEGVSKPTEQPAATPPPFISFKEQIERDFKRFEEQGIESEHFKEILDLLAQ